MDYPHPVRLMQIAESRPTALYPVPILASVREPEIRLEFACRSHPNRKSHPAGLDVRPHDPLERFTLFAQFQPLVERLIRRYGEEIELREDLVGEIYCRFCAVLDAYDPTRGIPLRPYLVHQLTYSVYSFVRCQWRRRKREIRLEIDTIAPPCARSEDVSAQWDDAVMMRNVQEGLPFAISQLSRRQRQVVIWRYYESRSFDEIAELLDVRLATARSTLRHALNNMRRNLVDANLIYE